MNDQATTMLQGMFMMKLIPMAEKILSENYFQHADHFSRILSEKENYKFSKDKDNKNPSIQATSENVELTSKQDEVQEKETFKS